MMETSVECIIKCLFWVQHRRCNQTRDGLEERSAGQSHNHRKEDTVNISVDLHMG